MTARILITRSQPRAAKLAAAIRSLHLDPVVVPLLEIEPVADVTIPDSAFTSVMITSHHALPALQEATRKKSMLRNLPLFVVGEKTAMAAKALGFSIASYAADVEALCAIIALALPLQSHVLYLSGRDIRHDPALLFPHATITRVIVYKAQRQPLPDELTAMLRMAEIDAIILQSTRTAEHFLAELTRHNLTISCDVLCFSPAIAASICHAQSLKKAAIHICSQPDELSLIALLKALYL